MKESMNVLVACESSGIIREEFRKRGHLAVSCDLKDTEIPGRHYKGYIFDIINDGWDFMIAHPPCTYLCSSGMHWTTRGLRDPQLTEDAVEFVEKLINSNIPKICIENPIGVLSTRIRKPDQYIQPYNFGEDAKKKTGLWLYNLPKLKATDYVEPRIVNGKERWSNQTDSGHNKLGESKSRAENRSRTYPGIAKAMANQWG